MRYLKNEKGVALAMALVLAVISLAFASSLMYISTRGAKMSGLEKRYKTALGASKGGIQLSSNIVGAGGNDASALASFDDTNCLNAKLFNKTAEWATTGCPGADQRNADPFTRPDVFFVLGAAPDDYVVSVKIIDTIEGNSPPVSGGSGETVDVKGVVEGGRGQSGIIVPLHMPFLYTIEVVSRSNTNPDEIAQVTYLYGH